MRQLISHRIKQQSGDRHILLKDHLESVGTRAASIVWSLREHIRLSFSSEDLALAAFVTGVCHDFGKSKRQFQDYIWGGKTTDKNHAQLSSLFAFLIAAELFRKRDLPAKLLPFVCAYAVNRHHGLLINLDGDDGAFNDQTLEYEYQIAKLSIDERIWSFSFEFAPLRMRIGFSEYRDQYFSYDPRNLVKQMNKFAQCLRKESAKSGAENSWLMDLYLSLFLIISALTECDQACVIDAPEPIAVRIINSDKVKECAFAQPKASRILQRLREKAWHQTQRHKPADIEPVLRLTLPTGVGKTLMGLYLGGQLQHKTCGPVIYALPYLSIIEQVTNVAHEMFSPDGFRIIQHHSLSFPQSGGEKESPNFAQARFALEQWDADLIITTFDQLLYSFLSADRGFIHRFFRLPGATLILDEVQSLPARLIPAVETLLTELQKKLGVKILYMTATHPPFLKKAQPVLKEEATFYKLLNRTTLKLNIREPISFSEYLKTLPEWLSKRKNKNILFVANTIRSSLQLFEYLQELKGNDSAFKDLRLIYLSGNVIPIERISRIDIIKGLLNKEERFVVVSTQCVEAGVDIDMDEVVRDFAPWDSLMQICGRANRAGKGKTANVSIYRWFDDSNGREFSHYIYDDILSDATLKVLGEKRTIAEKDYWSVHTEYTQQLERILSTDIAHEILRHALSWQFDEIGEFRKLFRGTESWKVSLFCEADDTSQTLKDISVLLWNKERPETIDALQRVLALCKDKLLFEPLHRFLRVDGRTVLQFVEQLNRSGEKKLRYELNRILRPMLQAYTISISVKRAEQLPVSLIVDGFPYLPREYYDPLKGAMGNAAGDRSNIL